MIIMYIVIIGSCYAGITAVIRLRQNSDDVNISMMVTGINPRKEE